jgi:hypothetical protein
MEGEQRMITTEEGTKDVKICAQCKHYEYSEVEVDGSNHLCQINKGKFYFNIVTGERQPSNLALDAVYQRMSRKTACGPEGLRWEPIP